MEARELIAEELHTRLASVPGTNIVFRNPKKEPTASDLNCLSFFELGDVVVKPSMMGGIPYYIRVLNVIIEALVSSATEGASTPDLVAYVKETKKKLYADGNTLGGLCDELIEVDTSQIIRPPIGDHVAGIGMSINIKYKEDIRLYFT